MTNAGNNTRTGLLVGSSLPVQRLGQVFSECNPSMRCHATKTISLHHDPILSANYTGRRENVGCTPKDPPVPRKKAHVIEKTELGNWSECFGLFLSVVAKSFSSSGMHMENYWRENKKMCIFWSSKLNEEKIKKTLRKCKAK